MRNWMLLLAGFTLFGAAAAPAARRAPITTPAQVQRLMNCRSITAADQRLACYDRESAAIQQAITNEDLYMVDREKARAATRSLFGFSIPNFGGLFGNSDQISQIEGTIKSAGRNSDGGWVITLDDGSVWSQTDDWPGLDPRPGKKAIVKRGALGSFWLSISGQNGIKVRRVG